MSTAGPTEETDVFFPHGSRLPYGDGRRQFGVLYPAADPDAPVVVLVHGGFWRGLYNRWLMLLLVRDLTSSGIACFNVEYRRLGALGGGGGFPETFHDVRDAVALMADRRRDRAAATRSPLIVVGHSAGAHLALVAAADLADEVDGVVSIAGPTDLRRLVGDGSEPVAELLERAPETCRYALTSPIERLPLGVPVVCVHGTHDATVDPRESIDFVTDALAAGDDARLELVPSGTHRAALVPSSDTWRAARRAVTALVHGRTCAGPTPVDPHGLGRVRSLDVRPECLTGLKNAPVRAEGTA